MSVPEEGGGVGSSDFVPIYCQIDPGRECYPIFSEDGSGCIERESLLSVLKQVTT